MRYRRERGFTMVELLVVIAITGIILSLLLPAVNAAREAARQTDCRSNMRQIGFAMQMYHDIYKHVPPGWTADNDPEGPPGWGWASLLLAYMDQRVLYESTNFELPIQHPDNQQTRETIITTFLCPSSPGQRKFLMGAEVDDHDHDHDEDGIEDYPNIDEGDKILLISRSNYVAVFGTNEIEDEPSRGDGSFFHNSNIQYADVRDGLSHTLFVGERSGIFGGSVWAGVVPDAAEPLARVVGTTDHPPNDPHFHFDDFSSHHVNGAHFLLGDGSVRRLDSRIDISVYHALATRNGGEGVPVPD